MFFGFANCHNSEIVTLIPVLQMRKLRHEMFNNLPEAM